MTKQSITVDGVDIQYSDHAFGTPGIPLLCIHGLESSHLTWRNLTAALGQGRRVIAIDMPGFGESGKPLDWPYTVEHMAHLLKAIVDGIGLSKVILCGHSIGGAVCDLFARLYPDYVAGLVLIASYRLVRLGQGDMNSKAAKNILLFSYFDKSKIPIADAAKQKSFYNGPYLQDLRKRISEAMIGTPLKEIPTPGPVPCRIIWGREDLVLDLETARGCVADYPDAEFVIIDQAGHAVHEECPEKVADDLMAFCETYGL